LLGGQAGGELDLDSNDKVAALCGLLALGHAQVGVALCPCRSRGPATSYAELFTVDCLNSAPPAGKRFFEVEFDGALDVVAFACEERVWFLENY
jgi:hypothetical protein